MDWLSIFTLTVGDIHGAFTAAYVLCALGLAVHFGFTGLLNFGQAAFAALGAYGFSVGVNILGWNMWASIALGLTLTIIFAILLGIPTLRLRADYLAIVTIAASQSFNYFVSTTAYEGITGGPNGLTGFADEFYALNPIPDGRYEVLWLSKSADDIWAEIVGWSLVAICAFLLFLIIRSPWGRVLKGIREDEDAVRSLGKNVFAYKIQSLIFGGVFASLGGMLFVVATQTNQPATWGTNFTFMLWTVLLLGGAATILGPIVGGMMFFALTTLTQGLLEGLVNIGWLPFLSIPQVGQIRLLLVGLALMLLVIFRPQGVLGNKKETFFNAR